MTVEADERAQLHALADILESWAREIPNWQPGTVERWDAFATRRYEAEQALESRLRQLPSCQIWADSSRSTVELMLAGIRVLSHACLSGACRAWATKARRHAHQLWGDTTSLQSRDVAISILDESDISQQRQTEQGSADPTA